MIYLFDNTSSEYIKRRINPQDYTDVLYFCPSATPSLLETISPAIEQADWIFMHRSFESEFEDEFYIIAEEIADWGKKVPLLIFSDGDGATPVINKQTPTYVQSFKKSEFYSSLPSFLNNIRTTETVDIRVLLTKESKNNVTEGGIVSLGREILMDIRFSEENDIVCNQVKVDTIKDFFSALQPEIGIDTERILNALNAGEIKANELRTVINKVIDSFNTYGRNIYTWTR